MTIDRHLLMPAVASCQDMQVHRSVYIIKPGITPTTSDMIDRLGDPCSLIFFPVLYCSLIRDGVYNAQEVYHADIKVLADGASPQQ